MEVRDPSNWKTRGMKDHVIESLSYREAQPGVEGRLERSKLGRGKKRKLIKGTNQTSIYFGKKE